MPAARPEESPQVLEAALSIARKYPVFPVRSNQGKRPALSNARAARALGRDVGPKQGGYRLATRKASEVEALFQEALKNGEEGLVVGVAMEAAGLVAIDLDLYKGGEAAQWIAKHQELFANDRLHQTASGGLHIILQAPPDTKFPGKVPRLTDAEIKHKGFVVWPHEGNGYEVLNDVEPQGMTADQLALLTRESEASPSADGRYDDTPDAVYEKQVLDGENFHDAFLVLSRRWADHGWRYDDIVSRCGALLRTAVKMIKDEERKARAQQLLDEIQSGEEGEVHRLVAGATQVVAAKDYSDLSGAVFDGPAFASMAPAKAKPAPVFDPPKGALIEDDLQLPRDERSIRARQWLCDAHYVRGYVSMTAAPGGTGKSTLSMIDALSMALGVGLIGQKVVKPLRVLYWCGEDPHEEIERRLIAAMKYYEITNDDLRKTPGRLFFRSGREYPLKIAILEEGGHFVVGEASMQALSSACEEMRLDCVILDPFSSAHLISENSNEQMAGVLEQLRHLAEAHDISLELVHHTTKEGRHHSRQAGISVARGASAIVDAARSARLLAPMTKEQAQKYQLDANERGRYIEIENGKANMVHAMRPTWIKLDSVQLDNAEELYPEGDAVGVAAGWTPPPTIGEDFLTMHEGRAVAWLYEEQPDPDTMRQDNRSTAWAGYTIADGINVDVGAVLSASQLTEEQSMAREGVKELLESLIDWGVLELTLIIDAQYKKRPAYKVRVDRAKAYLREVGIVS